MRLLNMLILSVLTVAALDAQPDPFAINIDYVGKGNPAQRLDLYLPSGAGPFPLAIFIHGGGWSGGSKTGGGAAVFAGTLLPRGIAVASINYRLSGEAIFPAQVQDCKAAVRFLRANAAKYQINPDRIGLIGDSAGSHLAMLTATTADVTIWDTPDMPNPTTSARVSAVVDQFGPVDFFAQDPYFPASCPAGTATHGGPGSFEALLLGCTTIGACPDKVKAASPLTYLTPDDPPILAVHGSHDCTASPENSRLLAEAMVQKGLPVIYRIVPGATHQDPEFLDPPLQTLMADFLERTLNGKPTSTSTADYEFADFTANQMVSIFASYLGNQQLSATQLPLPDSLGGFSASVRDSAGKTQPAGIIALAPGQLNILLPATLASGAATLTVSRNGQTAATEGLRIADLAPTLFTAYSNGSPLPVGDVVWTDTAGRQQRRLLLSLQGSQLIMPPLPLADSSGPVTLELYGTGIAGGKSAVAVLGDDRVTVTYAGKQGSYPGFDQYNVEIPKRLAGQGPLMLGIKIDGVPASPLRIVN